MDPTISNWMNLVFRWAHVVAGITWIGLLYYFNWMNGAITATFDADTKKKVVPELMPRVLYWFRWGAAYTWITGILLLGIVYYMGGTLVEMDGPMGVGAATGLGLGVLVVAWVIYDFLWKAMLDKEPAGVAVSYVLTLVVLFALFHVMTGRAAYIHVGAMFGTLMAANVWMRIWPAQRRIIKATKEGNAPDPKDGATAKLRSKHNTYMSVPLVFMMVSNHFPTETYGVGYPVAPVILAVLILVGWGGVKFAYGKGGSAAPAQY